MADPMRIRAQQKDDVSVLMAHPRETGQRKDAAGKMIPAPCISDVKATSGERTVLAANWDQAIAQNPFLQFRFKGAKAGDKVSVARTDNSGDTRPTRPSSPDAWPACRRQAGIILSTRGPAATWRHE